MSAALSTWGTILGTSNKGNPFQYPVETPKGVEVLDYSSQAIQNYRDWKLDALIAIGGDGTMHIVDRFTELGLNFIGVPKTIDNDLCATDVTFGYDSAVSVATKAIDRLHTTAIFTPSRDGGGGDGQVCGVDSARSRNCGRRAYDSHTRNSIHLGEGARTRVAQQTGKSIQHYLCSRRS